jgi:phospholipase/lecithinase/hemolysin
MHAVVRVSRLAGYSIQNAARFVGAKVWRVVALSVLLVACGGGGGQVTKFVPGRVLSFGDEYSVITATGRNYSINGLNTEQATIDCGVHRVWNQILANANGLTFPECDGGQTAPVSRILATPGARVDDVQTQIDQFLAADRFAPNDLISVMAGPNDLWAQYALYDGSNETVLVAAMESAGRRLATQVNRVAQAGARVIISTMPDQSLTPLARAERAAYPETDRAALIKRLMTAFHTQLRLTIINDGTRVGLVLADELTQQIVDFPSSYNYDNIDTAACLDSAVLPDCTSNTLNPGASPSNWLWADGTRPSPGFHSTWGESARVRLDNNPF